MSSTDASGGSTGLVAVGLAALGLVIYCWATATSCGPPEPHRRRGDAAERPPPPRPTPDAADDAPRPKTPLPAVPSLPAMLLEIAVPRASLIEREDRYMRLPLTWDSSIGEYVAPIELGNPPVQFFGVPDTGSSHLLVAGSKCAGCDSRYGRWPDERMQAVGEMRLARFGSQRSVYVPHVGSFFGGDPVEFGVVADSRATMRDATPVNVLGLQPNGPLSRTRYAGAVAFDLAGSSPSLTIGMSPQVASRIRGLDPIPMLSSSETGYLRLDHSMLSEAGSGHVSARLSGIELLNGSRSMRVPGSIAPDIVLFDTGTTSSLASARFVELLKQSGANAMRLSFDNGSSVDVPIDHLRMSTIEPWPAEHGDFGSSALLIGNRWLHSGFLAIVGDSIYYRPSAQF